jgi:hypothetical protein
VQKGKFPVIGFVKDPTGVAALYLGKREGKGLVYMGKVGTSWSSGFQPNSETARYGGHSEIQTRQTHPQAQGDVGPAVIYRGSRVPRRHV